MSQERFRPLTVEEMTPAQRRMAENLLSGPRKGMRGPFSALLYSPEMGDAAQELGARVRFKNSLPDKLKELAILTVARFWTAQFEWYAHQRLALEAGLNPTIAADIAAGKRPAGMHADEAEIGRSKLRLSRLTSRQKLFSHLPRAYSGHEMRSASAAPMRRRRSAT